MANCDVIQGVKSFRMCCLRKIINFSALTVPLRKFDLFGWERRKRKTDQYRKKFKMFSCSYDVITNVLCCNNIPFAIMWEVCTVCRNNVKIFITNFSRYILLIQVFWGGFSNVTAICVHIWEYKQVIWIWGGVERKTKQANQLLKDQNESFDSDTCPKWRSEVWVYGEIFAVSVARNSNLPAPIRWRVRTKEIVKPWYELVAPRRLHLTHVKSFV